MPRTPKGYGSSSTYYFDDEIAECSCADCKPYRMCWPREMFGTPKRIKPFSRGCSMKTLACERTYRLQWTPKYGRDEKGRALKKDGKPKARARYYPDRTRIESKSGMKMIRRGRRGHNETHAECAVVGCGWHPKEYFNKGAKGIFHRFEGDRGCKRWCRKHEQLRKAELREANPKLYVEKWKRKNKERAMNEPLSEKVYKRYVGKRTSQGDEVDITWEEWLSDYWRDKCPYLYIVFQNNCGKGKKGIRYADSPSIDRMDSSKQYQKDNVEVVSNRWNDIKRDSTVEERFAMGKEAALKIGYKWPPEPAEL
jgi:hypothetical protein